MHPYMLRQLAADQLRELIAQAGDARRAREARRARRRRPPTHLMGRSSWLYAQQRESSPEPRTLTEPGVDDRVKSGRP